MNRFSWAARIARAESLSASLPESSEVLNFYAVILRFQGRIAESLPNATDAQPKELNTAFLFQYAPDLVRLVRQHGPREMADAARRLPADGDRWSQLLAHHWNNPCAFAPPDEAFFARTLLQPYAEALAVRADRSGAHTPHLCPFCGARPAVAVLRGEGDGAKRSLLCSLCATEWEYRRLLCPACGEESKDNLPVFLAEDFGHVRIEACDACQRYLKAVDLTRSGHAVPVVDELAALALDVWAEENGYTKVQLNLLGM
ncbi:MAG: formate dehydrogenase accessory protein FdhE [Bryobacteraceae bacterium]